MQKTLIRRKIIPAAWRGPLACLAAIFLSSPCPAEQIEAGKNFIFHYDKFAPAPELTAAANETYAIAQQELKTTFRQPIPVFLHRDLESFRRATGAEWWIAGIHLAGQIHLQSPRILAEKGLLFSTIRHEIWLTFIDKAGAGRVAPWLAEGVALVRSREDARLNSIRSSSSAPADYDALDRILLSRPTRDKALAAYRTCVRLVHRLDKDCTGGATGIIIALSGDETIDVILSQNCKLTPQQLWETAHHDE